MLRVWLAAALLWPALIPGTPIEFPRDEGSHPAQRIEWWYMTGWLEDGTSGPLGFQVTFFRVRPGVGESNPSRFAPRQVLYAHAAIAEPAHGKLRHAQRSAREGFDLAYAREGRLDVRIDDWTLRGDGAQYVTEIDGGDFALALTLGRTQPPLLQGEAGYSRKGPGPDAASHYYSLPHLDVNGTVTVDGKRRDVRGSAWFDHEWSSSVMDPRARGWDWIGINLADGGALMAFRMRDASGGKHWAAATWRDAAGRVTTYAPEDVDWQPLATWQSPRTGARYPVRWRLRVGERRYEVVPLLDDAELDSSASTGAIYWEGPVRLLERRSALATEAGRGYLELTGYAAPLAL